MAMSRSLHSRVPARGFTLAEVIVAIAVLAIGLMAMAFLMAQTMSGTDRSKYMSLAATLASEKLEDLNRWPASDPNVAVTTASTAGSLTADIVQNVTVGASTNDVNYFDEIMFSAAGGAISEMVSGLDATGNAVYTTTSHQPNGRINISTSTLPGSTALAFKRRWLIEKDAPVPGVRRITVLVFLEDQTVRPPVSFQMSMVRP